MLVTPNVIVTLQSLERLNKLPKLCISFVCIPKVFSKAVSQKSWQLVSLLGFCSYFFGQCWDLARWYSLRVAIYSFWTFQWRGLSCKVHALPITSGTCLWSFPTCWIVVVVFCFFFSSSRFLSSPLGLSCVLRLLISSPQQKFREEGFWPFWFWLTGWVEI